MQRKTTIVSLEDLNSNVYNVTLSGRIFTAAGVSDDHLVTNVPTPSRGVPASPTTTTTTTTPPPGVPPPPEEPPELTTTTPEFLPEPVENSFNGNDEGDKQCSRIVFNQNFDTSKDIYVSFQSPKIPRLITESGEFILLTEQGDVLIANTTSNLTLFLVDGNSDVDTDPEHGLPGKGGGLMTTLASLNENMSGHFISMCLDFVGGYGLSGVFLDSGIKGNTELVPDSITARVSSTNSEYDFLSTFQVPNFNIFDIDVRSFRFVFKEHMNKIRVDLKLIESEIYETVFEAETKIEIHTLPSNVKVGLAASGNEPFSIKDITYSAN